MSWEDVKTTIMNSFCLSPLPGTRPRCDNPLLPPHPACHKNLGTPTLSISALPGPRFLHPQGKSLQTSSAHRQSTPSSCPHWEFLGVFCWCPRSWPTLENPGEFSQAQLPPCCFKFNFPCLPFNLMYSFDLSCSPFSCLPEFADTGEV